VNARKYGKPDANHKQIVDVLRKVGATVCDLKAVGAGVPDLLVGHSGRNYLVEVKDGSKCPSKSKLNELQVEWHEAWRGQAVVIKSVDELVAWLNDVTARKGWDASAAICIDGKSSTCCHAPVVVRGNVTRWHECTECGKPCDVANAQISGGTPSAESDCCARD